MDIIHSVVVSLIREQRVASPATRCMSDDEYDAWDELRLKEYDRKQSERVLELTPEVQSAG